LLTGEAVGSLLIRNGRVINPALSQDALLDVLVEGERIVSLSAPGTHQHADKIIDASGCYVTPGLIDLHVHFREPGETHKEDLKTGSLAAVAGGFTAVCAMANTNPPNDSPQVTALINARAKSALCRIYPVGALSMGLDGKALTSFFALQREGCVAISDDGKPVVSGDLMRRALLEAKALGLTVSVHEEDPTMMPDWSMHEGEDALRMGLTGLPSEAEEAMVARDLLLAEKTGGWLHIAHVSTYAAISMISAAKKRGVNVTCEVTPHHLHLTTKACCGYDTNAKMAPPLRTDCDVQAMRQALADGTIDAIATDHAPHSTLEKNVEFEAAAKGIIGLETALPLTLALVRSNELSLMRAIDALTAAAARCFGLMGGVLAPTKLADICIIDPEQRVPIISQNIRSKSKNTPFLGQTLQGAAVYTIVGGQVVYQREP
jgi:dihydroorotase